MTTIRASLLLRASALVLAVAPAAVGAQTLIREAEPDTTPGVPRGMMPPSGKCRVWMEGVPAARQPAPTDCATALRRKPANARVIYGPNTIDQRQAGLNAARDQRPSLLTPIGERRPAIGNERTRSAAGAGARGPGRAGQAATRADTHSTRVAPPTATTPAGRLVTPTRIPPTPAPAKTVPPKKPERP